MNEQEKIQQSLKIEDQFQEFTNRLHDQGYTSSTIACCLMTFCLKFCYESENRDGATEDLIQKCVPLAKAWAEAYKSKQKERK